MRIYEELENCTVMGLSDDELKKEHKKRTVYEEIMTQRVMRLTTLW